jgi:nucleotide-binding universal stress UspA family protein
MSQQPGGGIGEGRIVVGVDGSTSSKQALLWGGHFAALLGAQLTVVTAWEYPQLQGWAAPLPSDWNPAQGMDTALHDTVRAVFGAEPPAGMQLQVLEGGAAKVLLDACECAVLLVVGSRGHGGFAGLLLGSVSANVAEHASCPVFIVHGDRPPPG